MTRLQERTLSAYITTVDYLAAQAAITNPLPHFAPLNTAFALSVKEIRDIEQQQIYAQSTIGSQSKQNARAAATNDLALLHNALSAYAVVTQNTGLKQQLKVTIYKYMRMADTSFAAQCQMFYNLGQPLAAALLDYNISATFFPDFQAHIDEYVAVISAPRQTIISRSDSTAQLKIYFAQAKQQLADLSTFLGILQFSQPNFYKKFVEATRVTGLSTNALDFRCLVQDQNNDGVSGIKLTFTDTSTNATFTYTTNANGIVQRQSFTPAIYSLTISKRGYTSLTGKVVVQHAETYQLVIDIDTTTKTVRSGRNPKTGETI